MCLASSSCNSAPMPVASVWVLCTMKGDCIRTLSHVSVTVVLQLSHPASDQCQSCVESGVSLCSTTPKHIPQT
jgi:hypothetical protein